MRLANLVSRDIAVALTFRRRDRDADDITVALNLGRSDGAINRNV